MIEGVNLTKTYCKNFCKCHNVPLVQQQKKKKKKWQMSGLLLAPQSCLGVRQGHCERLSQMGDDFLKHIRLVL
jgi:hypothetical protein